MANCKRFAQLVMYFCHSEEMFALVCVLHRVRVCSPYYVCYTVLEKKTEQVKNDQVKVLSEQMKITRPPSPPASG